MSTLDLIAALIVAVHRNDVRRTGALLDALESRLPADELVALLELLFDEGPAPSFPTVGNHRPCPYR